MGQAMFAKIGVIGFTAIAVFGSWASPISKEVQAAVVTVDPGATVTLPRQPRLIAQYASPMVDPDLIAANTRFGFKVFSEILRQNGVGNVTVAPASVAIALSMTYNGASGETQRAMAQTLELQGMSLQQVNQSNAALQQVLEEADPQVQLAIANSLWSRDGITLNPDFLRRNQDFYHAEIATLNFASPTALLTINGWVNRNTQGRIPEILSRIDQDAVLFLINAMYFKGNWTRAFERSATVEQPFHLLNGSSKQHPMMTQRGSYFYLENAQFQAINLPYGNERFSMYIFLPRSGSSLTAFLQTLTADNWAEWNYQFDSQSGSLRLPRFKLNYSIELSNVLKAIGMANAFDSSQANFSGISNQRTSISFVQHKTFIEVNEEGTEATASTAIGVSRSAAPIQPPFQMVVDRPFFYAIQDNETGQVLFMGTVVDPQV
ncbi:MAG: serpin family protein [Oculatellaceae cyanobacterium bins.114]|nr:serpin family protein [Oculatellaceae cyanobacterium bins.114]